MQGVHPWRLVPPLPARQEHRPHHIQVRHHHDHFQYHDDDDAVQQQGLILMQRECTMKHLNISTSGSSWMIYMKRFVERMLRRMLKWLTDRIFPALWSNDILIRWCQPTDQKGQPGDQIRHGGQIHTNDQLQKLCLGHSLFRDEALYCWKGSVFFGNPFNVPRFCEITAIPM